MEIYAKEQVSKEVLEIILEHFSPKLTSETICLFDTSITYYYPADEKAGNGCNTVAFSALEKNEQSYYLLVKLEPGRFAREEGFNRGGITRS